MEDGGLEGVAQPLAEMFELGFVEQRKGVNGLF